MVLSLAKGATALAVSGGIAIVTSMEKKIRKSEVQLHPPSYPFWPHKGFFFGIFDFKDCPSIRRGFQVYKQVCQSCHSMKYRTFQDLIGVSHTKDEAAKLAAEYQYYDGPDNDGNMFHRPGRVSDPLPSPYENDKLAAAANNGAVPPDLTFITRARGREGCENYIFALLMNYMDPPAGITVAEGLYYNPYFYPGKLIAMPPPLYNGAVQYKDGTPAFKSQLCKDVSCFLAWAADPPRDDMKKMAFKFLILWTLLMSGGVAYKYNQVWAHVKTRKYFFSTLKKPGGWGPL